MSRLILSAVVTGLLGQAAPASAQTPNVVAREWTVTVTVERIQRSSRVVTFRQGSSLQDVYLDPNVALFDDFRVGDVVTMRDVESEVMHVRPDAQPSEVRDTTEEARKAGGSQVIAQTRAVVTIEKIDAATSLVAYRTAYGQQNVRIVNDKQLLEGVRPGDRVEVTLTLERAVDIQHKKP
jgi:hypothetical protein